MIYDNYRYFLLLTLSSYVICIILLCICVVKVVYADRPTVAAAQVAV
jgi:NADH:ubiquinone oxidoreductase subunit H